MGPGPDSAAEVLAGLVERVTFHSEESGFCAHYTHAEHFARRLLRREAQTGPLPCLLARVLNRITNSVKHNTAFNRLQSSGSPKPSI